MFKLPNLPSPRAEPHELADFAELLAWDKGKTSAREIVAYLGRLDDNDGNVGCDDDDDENAAELDEVMNEVDRRRDACKDGYPFVLELDGTVLRSAPTDQNHRSHIYHYLLLATRLNMKTSCVHADIDGTKLLEELSAKVLQCYLGSERARTLVFGTGIQGGFEEKISHLCKQLGEGGCFRNVDDAAAQARDDKLDTVTWVPFSDGKPGQLIVFGQCKTGSNWRDLITQLQPDAFIKRWMSNGYFLLNPLRALCVSEAADRSRWSGVSVYAGLFLDRCRLVDHCESIDPELLDRVKAWNAAAKMTVTLG
jgi:hypothetical protein